MDLCTYDLHTGILKRQTHTSGSADEGQAWDEHSKFISDSPGDSVVLVSSSTGYHSGAPHECDISDGSHMKWTKTDLYLFSESAGDADMQRLTYFNEVGHPHYCNCTNALPSDLSWNGDAQSAIVFYQQFVW